MVTVTWKFLFLCYCLPTKSRKSNVFSRVCLSICDHYRGCIDLTIQGPHLQGSGPVPLPFCTGPCLPLPPVGSPDMFKLVKPGPYCTLTPPVTCILGKPGSWYTTEMLIVIVRNISCGKVMFSQVCVKNSVHREGMHGRGGLCVVEGGMCCKGGACMAKGACMARGMHDKGGHAWQGEGVMCGRRDSHCSGRYASYWNAFLFPFRFRRLDPQ